MHMSFDESVRRHAAACRQHWGCGLIGPAAPAAMSVSAAPATQRGCLSAPANARQMGGGDGTDPNSVSVAEAQAMEAEFQAGIEGLQARNVARGKGHAHSTLPKFVRIATYVHVITEPTGTGDVTSKQIRTQMRSSTTAFAGRTSCGRRHCRSASS